MDWFRSWHGAPTDLKWPVVARRATEILHGLSQGVTVCVTDVTSVTWVLLDYSSQNSPRGSVQNFDAEGYAMYAGVTIEKVNAVIAALHDKKVLKDNEFVNWAKRQSSDGAERTRLYRERKKKDDLSHVTDRASHVTRGEKIRDSIPGKPQRDYSVNFERLWSLWRPFEMVKGSKQAALKSYEKIMDSGVPSEAILKGAELYCRNCHQLRSKTQHLTTWLNQRGWDGLETLRPYVDPMSRMPSPAGG